MNKPSSIAPPSYLLNKKKIVDKYIEKYIPDADEHPQSLNTAIRYSILAGGKRLRPILAIAAYETCGGNNEVIFPAAAALEFIHTYSLIHDDLPCMDNDDLRRGQPTLHKKYGEAVALLAGDALHDMAFHLMAETNNPKAVLELAEAIGTRGMLGGQIADMEAEGKTLTLEEITFIHTHKTGKLIRGAARIGATLAEATPDQLEGVSTYGEKIGLAFQIIDDILDIEGKTELLGKPIGSDLKNFKATFPGVVGIENARETAATLIDEAVEIIEDTVLHPEHFIQIARFIGGRQN
jgi:geranylgeranyl diphosphate synthase type II